MANTNRDLFITFNVKTSSVSGENFNFYITDKKTSNFFVQLVTGVTSNAFISKYTTLENASNYELILNIIKPNNEVLQLIGTLMNEKDSIYQFDLKNTEKDLIGVYNCEFWIKSIVDGQEEITTSAPWTYKVSPSVTSNLDGVIEKDPDYPLVLQLKEDIEGLQQETRVIQQETQIIRDGYDSLIDQGVDDYVATHVSNTFSDLNAKIDNAETDIDSIQNNISTIETNIDSMQNNISTIETKNYEQDANLKSLFAHTSYNLDADVMAGNARLINSKEGIGHINSIDGNTMVNVCDQKDPMPLTKSYEVTGTNHIALQGEYNGKCKPYVYGNTMVNLAKSREPYQAREDGSILNVPLELNQNLQANKTYTLITNASNFKKGVYNSIFFYNMLKFTDGTTVQRSMSYTGNGLYKKTFVPEKEVEIIYITIGTNNYDKENNIIPTITLSDIIILEGDWTNKDIPSYFTGLQSSFEDGYIPVNLINDINYTSDRYTLISNANNSMNLINDCYLYNPSNLTIRVAIGVVTDLTSGIDTRDYNGSTLIPLGTNEYIRYVQCITTQTDEHLRNLQSCVLVRGDYSNYDFSTYDSEHQGKYKVEYKVTGKNLIPYVEMGDILVTNGQNNNSDVISRTGFIPLKANKTYTLSLDELEDANWYAILYYDVNKNFIKYNNFPSTPTEDMYIRLKMHNPNQVEWKPQVEEGTVATAYEPYKEDIKTLYLNSPLLEGDSIEVGGKYLYHVHRRKQMILDGNNFHSSPTGVQGKYRWDFINEEFKKIDSSAKNSCLCDRYPSATVSDTWGAKGEGVTLNSANNRLIIYLERYSDGSNESKAQLISELQSNPTTVVYELATPTYEVISTNDDLYLDSYIGGHLDFNSAIPIEKVMFSAPYLPLKYMKTNTNYILQFKSDGVGKIDSTFFGGENNLGYSFNVVKGLNKFNMSTRDGKQNNAISIKGIGCTMSDIVVTESTDSHFGYFEGVQSCDNEIDVILMNKNILPIQHDVKIPLFLEKGTTLILSTKNNALSKGGNVKLYNSANNVIWMGIDEGTTEKKLTLREDVYYIQEVLQPSTDYELEYQLEIGDKKTEYVPQKSVTKHFTLSEPLRGLPNGVCDRIVEKDGKIYVERNCKEITLDGSQTGYLYTHENSPDCITRGTPLSDGLKSVHQIVCDRLPYIYAGYSRNTKSVSSYGDANNGLAVYVSIPKNELKSANNSGIIEWLYQNPTTIIYQLETPTYELISEGDMEIKVFNNSSISTYSNIPVTKINLTYPTTIPSVYDIDEGVSTLSMVSDEQDMMLVDMATQIAVMQLTMM